MAFAFKTGRVVTLQFGGSITAATQTAGPGSIPGTASGDTGSSGSITCNGWVFTFNAFSKYDFGASSENIVTLLAPDGFNTSQEEFNGDGTGPSSSIDAGGSWGVSIDCEEWCSVYTPTASTVINGSSFPNFGGTAAGDSLPSLGAQFYLTTKIGGTNSGFINSGSISLSHSITIASEATVGFLMDVLASCEASGGNSNNTFIGTKYQGTALSAAYSQSITTAYGTLSVTATGGGASATVANQGGSRIEVFINPPIQFQLSGRLRSFGQAYPGSAKVTWVNQAGSTNVLTPVGGAFSDSVTQQEWTCESAYNNGSWVSFPTQSLQQWQAPALWLSNFGSDDSRDWRMQFQGFKWDALSLVRTASVEVDPCSALTHWSAGSHTTLALSGGGVTATASGGAGSVTLAIPSSVRVWEVFRYLQFSGLASEAMTLTVSLAGQTWNLPVGTSALTITLDLACSVSDTETVDNTQSRFPLQGTASAPTTTDPTNQYKMGWGVNYCDSLTVSGIPDGNSVTLTNVALGSAPVGETQTAITFLAPFLDFVDGWSDPGVSNTTVQPYLLVESDDRGPIDIPALCLVTPSGSGSPSYVWYSITQLATILNYFPGLAATLLSCPVSDGYHGSGQLGLTLGGLGSTYDWSSNQWTDWVDVGVTGTFPAQDLWDEVQIWPGAGQVWTESGAFGIPTPLRASKSLRGQAWGNVFKSNRSPNTGAAVQLFTTANPGITEGSGSANALGGYLTGSAWGFGNLDSTADLNLAPTPHLSGHGVIQNRQRFRASFIHASSILRSLGYDVSNAFRHVRTYINTSTNGVGMQCAGNVVPQMWTDIATGFTAIWARPRFQDFGLSGPIGLFYGDGTTCYWAQTYDEGATFGTVINMASGVIGDYEEGANGLRWFFKLVSPDGGTTWDVWCRLLDSQLNVVRDWTVTNVVGVDPEPIACRESPVFDGSWRIGLTFSQGGVVTTFFSPDGLTFG